MGREQHDDLGLIARDVVAREQLLEERQMDRAGKPRDGIRVPLLYQTSEQVGLAVAQAQACRQLALHECGHRHARDGLVRTERAVVQDQVEDNLAVERHARRHIDVDADILIRIRAQRVHARAAGRNRRITGRDHRNLLTEIERQLGALCAPELRLRDDFGVVVGLEKPYDRGRHGEIKVGRAHPS